MCRAPAPPLAITDAVPSFPGSRQSAVHGGAAAHDRETGNVDRDATVRLAMNERTRAPVEPLDEALERSRLEGAFYLRAEYTEGWALADQGGPLFAAMMHPGAERLILFHVVASGRCFVACADGEHYWANGGEVIVLPYGDVRRCGIRCSGRR